MSPPNPLKTRLQHLKTPPRTNPNSIVQWGGQHPSGVDPKSLPNPSPLPPNTPIASRLLPPPPPPSSTPQMMMMMVVATRPWRTPQRKIIRPNTSPSAPPPNSTGRSPLLLLLLLLHPGMTMTRRMKYAVCLLHVFLGKVFRPSPPFPW